MVYKESVSLWLVSEKTGEVFLQKRAETETGDDGVLKVQSNPFICQPTMNEKVEKGETIPQAITRGCREELGKDFIVPSLKEMFYQQGFTYKGGLMVGYNFRGFITPKQLATVKLHSGAMPKFVRVTAADLKSGRIKKKGDEEADPKKCVVLFPDQYQALKVLLAILDNIS